MNSLPLEPDACEGAFRAWRAGSGALLPYVKSTPFVSLSRYPTGMALTPPGAALSEPPLAPEEGEIVVIDLPGADAIQSGLALWRERGLWPILTLSHWFHPHGVVGDAQLASLLLMGAPPIGEVRGFSLVLDAQRYSTAPPPPDRFNNEYEVAEDDLPSLSELQGLSITKVAIVTSQPPKEDLARYAAFLTANGLRVRWIR